MATTARDPGGTGGEHGNAIAQLSSDLRLPMHDVAEVYRAQLDRISESARIRHFLSVLAASRTRALLRGSLRTSTEMH